jgi:DNA-binding MarR family transcriptional regulator
MTKKSNGSAKVNKNPVRLGVLEEIFTSHLQRVAYLLGRATEKAVQGYSLRTGTIGGLSIILSNPGCSQNDIVNSTTFDKSAVNAIVNNLEQLGWVERRRSDTDRRRYTLYATMEGEQAMARMISDIKDIEARLMAGMSPASRAQLLVLLDEMHRSCLADRSRKPW